MLDIFIEQTCVENRALELSIMRLRYRNDINDIVQDKYGNSLIYKISIFVRYDIEIKLYTEIFYRRVYL